MKPDTPQYQQLTRAAQKGDTRSYEILLRESAKALRPFLTRYVTPQDADDVIQETLLSVHKAFHTYDGSRPYRPWLFAIAKFRLNDYWRKKYSNIFNQAVDISDLEDILAAPVTESGPAYEDIKGELRQLSGKQSEIVELMHVDGYTAKEVGAKLGMKESAVKVAAHRAYKKLRERLGKDG